MTTAHESHAAAGTAATTARAEAKAGWWKNPLALHIAVAAGVFIVALIINFSFEFNFFWKLLVGFGLVWGGAKMSKTKVGPVNVWGNILRGLGWTMIVLALLNSGVRAVTEKSIGWVDQTLNEMVSGNSTGTKPTTGGIFTQKTQQDVYVNVDMRNMAVGSSTEPVTMSLGSVALVKLTPVNVSVGEENGQHVCPVAKKLEGLVPIKFDVVAGGGTTVVHMKMSPKTQAALLEKNINPVEVEFQLVKGPLSANRFICPGDVLSGK